MSATYTSTPIDQQDSIAEHDSIAEQSSNVYQRSASNLLPLLDEDSLPSPSIEEQSIPTVPTWTILDAALRT